MRSILIEQHIPEHGDLTIAKTQFIFLFPKLCFILRQFLTQITTPQNVRQNSNYSTCISNHSTEWRQNSGANLR